ncbi:type II toxin-antitoxin system HicB family antitoxin [Rhodanobacter sp. Col0626]|uniref:type II toxin-antitoxin system HicB family antitoxin n=1 Tax=Rhodanobacter sp. Col0626 TaxID=3415679 RepID=UPI003CF5FC6D
MRYPVAIELGGENTAFGVAVPDLPGVFSAGDTLDEAMTSAKEAILFGLEDYAERGEAFPAPTDLHELVRGKAAKAYKGWVWAVVEVDASKVSTKAVRVNITLPETVLNSIDAYTAKNGESRSGFLARAAMDALAA